MDVRQSEAVQLQTIVIMNILLLTEAQVISDKMEAYLGFLLTSKHENLTFRWRIVQGITHLMDQRVELVLPHLETVADIMTTALKEKDQKLALAATEFWSGIFQVINGNAQNE